MKWPALVLTLGTLIFFVSIASQTASAQWGGYGAGFVPSYGLYGQNVGVLPPSYYNPGFAVGSYGGFGGYGMGSQFALWHISPTAGVLRLRSRSTGQPVTEDIGIASTAIAGSTRLRS